MAIDYTLPLHVAPMVRDACVCLHAQRAARFLARRFDEALRPLALTSGQFSLLMSLHRPKPPGMSDVATILAMDRTTLTANVKPLERSGMVQVLVDDTDRRCRRLALTGKGRRRLAEALPVWYRVHGEIEAEIGVEAVEALRAVLGARA